MSEKNKIIYAFHNHVDLDLGILGKPGFNPSDFKEKGCASLTKDGKLISAKAAAETLATQSRFLKNFTVEPFDVVHDDKHFETVKCNNYMHVYMYVYIDELGVYGACKKSSLIFMLIKLFLKIELDKVITEQLSNNLERYKLEDILIKKEILSKLFFDITFDKEISNVVILDKEIDAFVNQPENSCMYEYAANIVDALDNFSAKKQISPLVYRFRNNYKTHFYHRDHEFFKQYDSLHYFNIDYSDDLVLLEPEYYYCIYINSNGYFNMPYYAMDVINYSNCIELIETI